jgi:hypothetical protein
LRRIVSNNHRTTAAQVTGQQNWIFNLKTLFLQKVFHVSFTNPTSTVELQLLSLGLLKVMLRCVNDGVTTIKSGHKTTGNTWYGDTVRWAICYTVPYTRKNLCLENIQSSVQSGMPASNSETHGRFCNGLGSNIMVQYSVGPIITLNGWITARECMDWLGNQVQAMIQILFLSNDAVFQEGSAPIRTAGTV